VEKEEAFLYSLLVEREDNPPYMDIVVYRNSMDYLTFPEDNNLMDDVGSPCSMASFSISL
jgi:hypothetical protein